MKRVLTLTIALVLPLASSGQEYPKVPPEHASAILAMPSGAVSNAVKSSQGRIDLPWRLNLPEPLEPGALYPMVVFLHGGSRRGDDNVQPMALVWEFIKPEAQTNNPCFVLAMQVPRDRTWTPLNPLRSRKLASDGEVSITKEMKALLALVEQLVEELPIDPERLYVMGQSMGGYGTWDALERRPDLWAAAVPICGGGTPAKAALFKDVPIWAWHAKDDDVIPVTESRDMINALRTAGGQPKYSEIPNGGHEVWNKAFADDALHEWLFSQKRSSRD